VDVADCDVGGSELVSFVHPFIVRVSGTANRYRKPVSLRLRFHGMEVTVTDLPSRSR